MRKRSMKNLKEFETGGQLTVNHFLADKKGLLNSSDEELVKRCDNKEITSREYFSVIKGRIKRGPNWMIHSLPLILDAKINKKELVGIIAQFFQTSFFIEVNWSCALKLTEMARARLNEKELFSLVKTILLEPYLDDEVESIVEKLNLSQKKYRLIRQKYVYKIRSWGFHSTDKPYVNREFRNIDVDGKTFCEMTQNVSEKDEAVFYDPQTDLKMLRSLTDKEKLTYSFGLDRVKKADMLKKLKEKWVVVGEF